MSQPSIPSSSRPLILVVGATGGFGSAAALACLFRGWRVRALTRRADLVSGQAPPPVAGLCGVEWVGGDAMDADSLVRAANGVQFIVHAANPPRYRRWRELALPMLANAVLAARASGARLLVPGNVYNFGPDAGALVAEGAPQHPLTAKGQVRVEMEQMLAKAAQGPRPARSLVLRAGDFFGGHGPSAWFSTVMVKPGKPLRQVVYPGEHEVGHAWAYLPDLAETLVRLMALDLAEPGRLSSFEVLHFAGHWLPRGVAMAEAVRRVSGQPELPIKAAPWGLMRLFSPLVPLFREILAMRYLWQQPLQLDQTRLASLIDHVPHTPLDEAVKHSLAQLLPGQERGLQADAIQAGSAG